MNSMMLASVWNMKPTSSVTVVLPTGHSPTFDSSDYVTIRLRMANVTLGIGE